MADVKLYIDGQQILPIVASDMLAMTGWEDSEDIKYCEQKSNGKFEKVDLLLSSDRYIAYAGDDLAMIVISKNRNVTLVINLDQFKDNPVSEADGYDYFVKTFYFSSIMTELKLSMIPLVVSKVDDDWIHLVWVYNDRIIEADISLYL